MAGNREAKGRKGSSKRECWGVRRSHEKEAAKE